MILNELNLWQLVADFVMVILAGVIGTKTTANSQRVNVRILSLAISFMHMCMHFSLCQYSWIISQYHGCCHCPSIMCMGCLCAYILFKLEIVQTQVNGHSRNSYDTIISAETLGKV